MPSTQNLDISVDNYQGEESDIVIASLTRSNASNDIGFMMAPERLNVLLSRARNGLIMIGNSNTFTKSVHYGKISSRTSNIMCTTDSRSSVNNILGAKPSCPLRCNSSSIVQMVVVLNLGTCHTFPLRFNLPP